MQTREEISATAEFEYHIIGAKLIEACQQYTKSSYVMRMKHHSTAMFALKFLNDLKMQSLDLTNDNDSQHMIKLHLVMTLFVTLEKYLLSASSHTFLDLLKKAKHEIYADIRRIDVNQQSLQSDKDGEDQLSAHLEQFSIAFQESVTQLNAHLSSKASWFATKTAYDEKGFQIFAEDIKKMNNPAEIVFSLSLKDYNQESTLKVSH